MSKLLTTNEAAEFLRVSERTIRRWRQNHVLPYLRIGTGKGKNKTVRYRLEDLRQLAEDLAAESVHQTGRARDGTA